MYYLAMIFVLYLALALLSVVNNSRLRKEKREADILIEELEAKIGEITRHNRKLQENYEGVKQVNRVLVGRELKIKRLKEELRHLKQVK